MLTAETLAGYGVTAVSDGTDDYLVFSDAQAGWNSGDAIIKITGFTGGSISQLQIV